MGKIKHLIKRVLYFLKHGKDNYGKLGFKALYYKGIPILLRDDIPKDELHLVDKDVKLKATINIETGEIKLNEDQDA